MSDASVFANKKGSVDPRQTDYGNGQPVGQRAKTSQKMRDRPNKKKAKGETDRPGG